MQPVSTGCCDAKDWHRPVHTSPSPVFARCPFGRTGPGPGCNHIRQKDQTGLDFKSLTFTATAHLPPPSFSMSEAIPTDDSPGPHATKKQHKVCDHHTDSSHASSKFVISHLSSQFLPTQFQMQVAHPSLGHHLHPGQRCHLCLYPKGAGATPAVQARPKDQLK